MSGKVNIRAVETVKNIENQKGCAYWVSKNVRIFSLATFCFYFCPNG